MSHGVPSAWCIVGVPSSFLVRPTYLPGRERVKKGPFFLWSMGTKEGASRRGRGPSVLGVGWPQACFSAEAVLVAPMRILESYLLSSLWL